MNKTYETSLTYQVLQRIRALPDNAILRADVADLGSPRQISRALKTLVAQQEIVKLGYGVYGKLARVEKDSPLVYLEGGFVPTVREALTKLKIDWEISQFERDYQSGRSTQVPVRSATRVKARFRRKLAYKNVEFRIEP